MNRLLITALVCLNAVSVAAQTEDASIDLPDSVSISVSANPPYSDQYQGVWAGYEISLLENIFQNSGTEIRYISKNSVSEKLESVSSGEVDLAAGGISITSDRLKRFAFSIPTAESSLVGIVHKNSLPSDTFGILGKFFSNEKLLASIAIFFLFIVGGGILLWFIERTSKKGSSGQITRVVDGIWCAFATATTIGYGDIVPRCIMTRIVTVPIALSGFIVLGGAMAAISDSVVTSKTPVSVNSAEDLTGKNVGCVKGTVSFRYLERNGIDFVQFDSIHQALPKMRAGEIDFFLREKRIAQRVLRSDIGNQLVMASGQVHPHYLGITALKPGPLLDFVNSRIVEFQESGIVNDLNRKYNLNE